MLKSDLVNVLVTQAAVPQREAEGVVEHIFKVMKDALCRGDHIEIRGLGTFRVKQYRGYTGRNPKTNKAIDVKPKRGVLFRAGKDLRGRMNAGFEAGKPGLRPTTANPDDPTEHAA